MFKLKFWADERPEIKCPWLYARTDAVWQQDTATPKRQSCGMHPLLSLCARKPVVVEITRDIWVSNLSNEDRTSYEYKLTWPWASHVAGHPTSIRHARRVAQYQLSRFHTRNPPMKIIKPSKKRERILCESAGLDWMLSEYKRNRTRQVVRSISNAKPDNKLRMQYTI